MGRGKQVWQIIVILIRAPPPLQHNPSLSGKTFLLTNVVPASAFYVPRGGLREGGPQDGRLGTRARSHSSRLAPWTLTAGMPWGSRRP